MAALRRRLCTGHDYHGRNQKHNGGIDLSTRLSADATPFSAQESEDLPTQQKRALHESPTHGRPQWPKQKHPLAQQRRDERREHRR